MPIHHAIWRVGDQPAPLVSSRLASEQHLEGMIVRDPRILSSEWMLIGRQEILKGKRVLDIAIGTGWSTEQLARAEAEVSGIDLTPKAIEISKKRWEVRQLPPADLRVADAQNLPYPDGTFDFVLAWGCLMHMPSTEKAISEIYRVLKPGGHMKAMMYNKHSLHWWYFILLSKGILRGKLLFMSRQELSRSVY